MQAKGEIFQYLQQGQPFFTAFIGLIDPYLQNLTTPTGVLKANYFGLISQIHALVSKLHLRRPERMRLIEIPGFL